MSSNPDSDLLVGACNTIVEALDPDMGPIRMHGNPIKLSAHEVAKTAARHRSWMGTGRRSSGNSR